MEYIRWITLARMEEKSLDRRYSQCGLLLVSRIFTKYIGFFTGMILAIVCAVFIGYNWNQFDGFESNDLCKAYINYA